MVQPLLLFLTETTDQFCRKARSGFIAAKNAANEKSSPTNVPTQRGPRQMPWVIMRTEPARELKAAEGLQDFDPYVPREARIIRQGKHRKTALKEIPAIPRLIFLYTPYSWGLQDIIGRKYTLGLVRDPTLPADDMARPAYVISDRQMGAFQCVINQMIYDAREAFSRRTPPKTKKLKLKTFDDLKIYFEGLAKADSML